MTQHKIFQAQSLFPIFANEKIASHLSGLSIFVLKKYREEGRLSKNIHWIKVPPKLVLYCVPLLLDWELNIEAPERHLATIEEFHKSFPLNLLSGHNSPSAK